MSLWIIGAVAAAGYYVMAKPKAAKKPAAKESLEAMKEKYLLQLNKFLKTSSDKGFTEEQIKEALAGKGWPKGFVDDYYKAFFSKK
jgi:hypothetical protein